MAIAQVHVHAWQLGYAGLLPADYLKDLRPEDRAASYRFEVEGQETLVAVDAGAVRGFINIRRSRDNREADEGEVSGLYVSPDAWRSGIGRALMTAGRAWMTERGYVRARLWVLAGNERAQDFYRADGWVTSEETRVDLVWGIQVDEILFTREILAGPGIV
jgi:ribosomal protein S18 acetylase RimI-like enzyme